MRSDIPCPAHLIGHRKHVALQVVGPDDQKDANQTWHWTAAIHISISVHIYIRIYIYMWYIHTYVTCIASHCITRHGLTPLVLVANIGFHSQVTLRFPCNFLSRRQRLRITDGFHYQFESLEEAYSRTCIKSETFETGIACSKSSADVWPTQQKKASRQEGLTAHFFETETSADERSEGSRSQRSQHSQRRRS